MEMNNANSMRLMMKELIQGRDIAKQFQLTLSSSSSNHDEYNLMIQTIIESFDRSIEILKSDPTFCSSSVVQTHTTNTNNTTSLDSPHSGLSGSPKSQDDISDADYFRGPDSKSDDHHHHNDPRKRKSMIGVERKKMPGSSDSGLEGPVEDGFSWRKYGQKDIHGANYPRAYYRCTFRQAHGCLATKQVQRNDDDPTYFDVAYRGKHTCSQAPSSSSLNPRPEIKPEPTETLTYPPNHLLSHGVIWSFGTEPKDIKPIITDDNKLNHNLSPSSFSFRYHHSSLTPTKFHHNNTNQLSNHGDFSTYNVNTNNYHNSSDDQQHVLHENSEVVPAVPNTGLGSQPMVLDPRTFSFDQGEFDHHDFMFDSPEFL